MYDKLIKLSCVLNSFLSLWIAVFVPYIYIHTCEMKTPWIGLDCHHLGVCLLHCSYSDALSS